MEDNHSESIDCFACIRDEYRSSGVDSNCDGQDESDVEDRVKALPIPGLPAPFPS